MTTSWYFHTECDNDPPHIQGFDGGPQAGVRCEGCGRPTDIRYDWEPAKAKHGPHQFCDCPDPRPGRPGKSFHCAAIFGWSA